LTIFGAAKIIEGCAATILASTKLAEAVLSIILAVAATVGAGDPVVTDTAN
jgi:hypothetical protein